MDATRAEPNILVVSTNREAVRCVEAVAAELRAAVSSESSPVPGDWDAVCLDETLLGANPSWLERLRDGARPLGLVWMTKDPRGPLLEAALAAGVDDFLSLPLWGPEVRARLGRVLELVRARRGSFEEVEGGIDPQAADRGSLYEILKRGKAEWESTFDTITDAISIIAPDRTIRRANRALARLVGKEPRDLVGHRCHSVLHGLDAPCPTCPVERAFDTGEITVAEGESFRTKHVFDYYAYPQKDSEGRVYAVIAYARDVTREAQLKAGLRRSEKLVSLGELAAGIAHEINNPLTSVSSYAQLLALRLEDPKSVECATRIQDGVERIHRLVRNLTSFVRQADQPFYPLDLSEVATDTLSFSRYELTRGETRLVEDLGKGLPKVLGAREQLSHLLVSLLTNARDAVSGRGTITVRTSARNASVVLEVEDDGVGIASAERDKIFEPFYTTKPEGKGTGLGLFVAAGIARNHKAEISVATEAGRGTRVSVSLPAFCA